MAKLRLVHRPLLVANRSYILKKIFTMSILTIVFCFVYAYSVTSHAKDMKLSQAECINLATTDKTYATGVQRVMELNAVKTWMSLLEKNSKRLAIGANVDKSSFKGGRCFWSISLYESDESKLQLWREYLVEINGSKIRTAN